MESVTDYRNMCVQLAQLLEQKNIQLKQLQIGTDSQYMDANPALSTLGVFAETLVAAARNSRVYCKSKGYADIGSQDFLQASLDALGDTDKLEAYKQTLLVLNLVAPQSFERGGIPARVDGKLLRVVRVPKQVYSLFVALDGERV